MLTIRGSQMQALALARRGRFLDDLHAFLRAEHPGQVQGLTDLALRERILEAVGRAEAYGLTWASAIAAFTTLTFVLRPDFDRLPEFAAILTDSTVPPNERIDALLGGGSVTAWASSGPNP